MTNLTDKQRAALTALRDLMGEHGLSIDIATGDVLITDNDGISEPFVISNELDIDEIFEVCDAM